MLDRDDLRYIGMFEVMMTTFGSYEYPTVGMKAFNDLSGIRFQLKLSGYL